MLNDIAKKNRYTIYFIEEMLAQFEAAKYLNKIDP